MPLETPTRIVKELARHGYNAEREAVTLIAGSADPATTLVHAVEHAGPDAFRVTVADVRAILDAGPNATDAPVADSPASETATPTDSPVDGPSPSDPSTSDASPSHPSPSDSPTSAASPVSADSSTATDSPVPADSPTFDSSTSDSSTSTDSSTSDSSTSDSTTSTDSPTPSDSPTPVGQTTGGTDPPVSTAEPSDVDSDIQDTSPSETEERPTRRRRDASLRSLSIAGDVTGQSTGTGEYGDFVKVFKDRYEKLSRQLRGRVNHRPADAIQSMSGGSDAAMIGLVDDVRSTASGHWIVELEDTTGTFPCLVMKDREFASAVDELLMDECIAVEGTLSDDAGIMFVDSMYSPDVPRTHTPNTADRHVQAALISDVHVGSQEFMADAWHRFADWLHTEEAERVEYLLVAGDMVEGVGVYPNQDEELDIVDIYDQYERFSEYLKEVPGDMEIVMIPGNHDAVRLAEPQPGFDEELRDIMSAHDARITGNPSTVTVEGVNVLMYHGVSLDEVIAELPAESASYDEPHKAMYQLLKKRHVAPQYGGHTRLAPEEKDYLVMEEVPDVFHTGHVHKLGWGKYHNVLAVNSGCWQAQTDFQRSVNIDPDAGYAPIVDLDTLDMTVRKFS